MLKIDIKKDVIGTTKFCFLIEIVLMILYPVFGIIVSNANYLVDCGDIGSLYTSLYFLIFHTIWFLIIVVDKIVTFKRKIAPHTRFVLFVTRASFLLFIVWFILLSFNIFKGYIC